MIETWDEFVTASFKEQRDYYFNLWNQGITDKSIAEGLGVPDYRICYWKKTRGIKTRRKYTNTFCGKGYTLCWDCKNALGGCSWSQRFDPVDGWEAIVTKPAVYLSEAMQKIPDYCVIKCPEFKKG